jgi:hypothetical protein
MQTAAEQLGMSISSLKRAADKLGLTVWPYRRVSRVLVKKGQKHFFCAADGDSAQFRSLKTSISELQEKIRACSDAQRQTLLSDQLVSLQNKLTHLRAHPLQQNHVVVRSSKVGAPLGEHVDVATALGIRVAPRSLEHALESLVLLLHKHAQQSSLRVDATQSLHVPVAQPAVAQLPKPLPLLREPQCPAQLRVRVQTQRLSAFQPFSSFKPTPALTAAACTLTDVAKKPA